MTEGISAKTFFAQVAYPDQYIQIN